MTFSVVGRSADGRSMGVAVASKFLAVGSAVPAARLGVGALATQSFANTLYKRDGIALLEAGRDAQATLDALLAADPERESRQAGVVDVHGRSATFTGSGCLDWAGGVTGDDVAIQGNILAGPRVVQSMHEVWLADPAAPLPERLVATLAAGEAAGGDRRGRQSAALLVVSDSGGYTPGDDLAYDLRVDDHPEPVPELARLLDLHHVYFDSPAEADLLPLSGALADEVRGHLARLGQPDLETWAGIENYELRVRPDRIDAFVLARLREAAVR
ncbi:MAG: DUF1028 domain-containing protein [Nocardioidaceae bacterium]|nr:DUF1028 domain-containing protein [Nocardioidaceae bacterium]